MPLIPRDSRIPASELRRIYAEHREGIAEFGSSMDTPRGSVTNPGRLLLARQLADDALVVFPASTEGLTDSELPRWVNVSYDVLIAVIELYKTSLDSAGVPRRRT